MSLPEKLSQDSNDGLAHVQKKVLTDHPGEVISAPDTITTTEALQRFDKAAHERDEARLMLQAVTQQRDEARRNLDSALADRVPFAEDYARAIRKELEEAKATIDTLKAAPAPIVLDDLKEARADNVRLTRRLGEIEQGRKEAEKALAHEKKEHAESQRLFGIFTDRAARLIEELPEGRSNEKAGKFNIERALDAMERLKKENEQLQRQHDEWHKRLEESAKKLTKSREQRNHLHTANRLAFLELDKAVPGGGGLYIHIGLAKKILQDAVCGKFDAPLKLDTSEAQGMPEHLVKWLEAELASSDPLPSLYIMGEPGEGMKLFREKFSEIVQSTPPDTEVLIHWKPLPVVKLPEAIDLRHGEILSGPHAGKKVVKGADGKFAPVCENLYNFGKYQQRACKLVLGHGGPCGQPLPSGATAKQETASPAGSRAWLAKVMDRVFEECRELRGAGQKEYAREDENAFANFERLAAQLNLPREKVLWTFTFKHVEGIVSWLNGHKSQRESVTGRINDVIVYLVILRGMIEQDKWAPKPASGPQPKRSG